MRLREPELFAENWGILNDESDLLVEDMESNGIDKVIIQPSVGEGPEMVAAAVKKHPDKFVGCFMTGDFDFFGGPNANGFVKKPDMGKFADTVAYNVQSSGSRGSAKLQFKTIPKNPLLT